MTQPHADKTALRRHLRDLRRAHAAQAGADAAAVLAQNVPAILQDCGIAPPAVIAAYYPLEDEISALPLLAHLRALGYRTALPVTQGRDAGLLFLPYEDGTPLLRSSFGVMEPAEGANISPDVLLVPLLGFDAACQRLGYGAGHYDRTLADLRAHKDVFAAGVAFDMQCVAAGIPAQEHDQPLDCVITEKGIYWPDTTAEEPKG